MGKIIFITTGDQEIRAWEIEKGDTALISASKIHSDISNGFIRAEAGNLNIDKAGGEKFIICKRISS